MNFKQKGELNTPSLWGGIRFNRKLPMPIPTSMDNSYIRISKPGKAEALIKYEEKEEGNQRDPIDETIFCD